MNPPERAPATDSVGRQTLERLADNARNYNRWMWERIRPWTGQRVLEIGAGLGTFSAFLVDRQRLVVTDAENHYVDHLRTRFAGRAHVRVGSLVLPDATMDLGDERFDTIICLNVLEHVHDDVRAIQSVSRALAPGGRLVLLVPALRALYGTLDEALGHARRYGPAEVRGKLGEAGLRTTQQEYFNLAGVPGWWFVGRVLRRRLIPTRSVAIYDALVPLFRLERHLRWRVGQSLITIGERRQ